MLRSHSDNSGFEWYRSSSFSSSTTTDDVTSTASVDNYIQRLEEIRAARRASVPDMDTDRLFLRVSSDAASSVSSQTLIDGNGSFEKTAPESSEPSKGTDSHAEHIRLRRLPEEHCRDADSFDIDEVSRYYVNQSFNLYLPQ